MCTNEKERGGRATIIRERMNCQATCIMMYDRCKERMLYPTCTGMIHKTTFAWEEQRGSLVDMMNEYKTGRRKKIDA